MFGGRQLTGWPGTDDVGTSLPGMVSFGMDDRMTTDFQRRKSIDR